MKNFIKIRFYLYITFMLQFYEIFSSDAPVSTEIAKPVETKIPKVSFEKFTLDYIGPMNNLPKSQRQQHNDNRVALLPILTNHEITELQKKLYEDLQQEILKKIVKLDLLLNLDIKESIKEFKENISIVFLDIDSTATLVLENFLRVQCLNETILNEYVQWLEEKFVPIIQNILNDVAQKVQDRSNNAKDPIDIKSLTKFKKDLIFDIESLIERFKQKIQEFLKIQTDNFNYLKKRTELGKIEFEAELRKIEFEDFLQKEEKKEFEKNQFKSSENLSNQLSRNSFLGSKKKSNLSEQWLSENDLYE